MGRSSSLLIRLVMFFLAVAFTSGAYAPGLASAQPAEDLRDVQFWTDSQRRKAAAAAQVVAVRDPLLAAVMRIEGKNLFVWDEFDEAVEQVQPLDHKYLAMLHDDTRMPEIGRASCR